MNNLDNQIKLFNDKLEAFENKIQKLEQNLLKKEEEIENLVKKNDNEEKNSLKKKNILKRIEDIENLNDEKDRKMKFLIDTVEKLEYSLKQVNENKNDEVEKLTEMVPCEYCDFSAKNERGMKLNVKAKHDITIVELNIFL